MRYLALGDSVSIDLYTGVPGGGAVAQFAARVGAEAVQDLCYDGCTVEGVLDMLTVASLVPDVITVTAGGNDLLLCAGQPPEPCLRAIVANLSIMADRLSTYRCPVILNTIYDPTDGDDSLTPLLGLTPDFRPVYERLNAAIRALTSEHGFLLADLQALCRGHGIAADTPWFVQRIEPNFTAATAIAGEWARMYLGR
jgi:lysophospholipase L1-like esterase